MRNILILGKKEGMFGQAYLPMGSHRVFRLMPILLSFLSRAFCILRNRRCEIPAILKNNSTLGAMQFYFLVFSHMTQGID